MKPLTSRKEVRKFIGVVNYYCYICRRQSHMLAPLNKTTSIKEEFKWTNVEQDSFNKIKQIMAYDTLLTYTYFNEIFKIRINAIAFQLGAVIIQKVKSIAFYSRKLTGSK